LLEHHVRNAFSMRQLPMFEDADKIWLSKTRLGLVTVVLRSAIVLHAEAQGLLPLGDSAYDRGYAWTPLAQQRTAKGAWRRFLRLSNALSGKTHAILKPWQSEVFSGAWLGPLGPPAEPHSPEALSDAAIHAVFRALLPTSREENFEIDHVVALYERLMEFELVRCRGRTIRWGTTHALVDLDELSKVPPTARGEYLSLRGIKPSQALLQRLMGAADVDDMLAVIPARTRNTLLPAGSVALQANLVARDTPAPHTPRELIHKTVRATLEPLVEAAQGASDRLLALRICDPSMGTGQFLTEACRQLAYAVVAADSTRQNDATALAQARWQVASRCLYGVDGDPIALELARLSLRLIGMKPDGTMPEINRHLRHGDALVGIGPWHGSPARRRPDPRLYSLHWASTAMARPTTHGAPRKTGRNRSPSRVESLRLLADQLIREILMNGHHKARKRLTIDEPMMLREASITENRAAYFHWPLEFPEIFESPEPGFDAFVGKPPWVSCSGVAAHPLANDLKRYFTSLSSAFQRNRPLHGLFVHRSASLLKPGGRLGLILPPSVASLGGLAPLRQVHDALCRVDMPLPHYGGRTSQGIVQPTMALLSTGRQDGESIGEPQVWPLHRDKLDE